MNEIFHFVYETLKYISQITGFSYKEVNIIVWFIFIPFTWAFLIDKIKRSNIFKILLSAIIIGALLTIRDFTDFSNSLFDKSADFLKSFSFLGMNYIVSSVVICVFIPILIYGILIRKAYYSKQK